MRTAFLCCLALALPALADDKKPEPITAKNIEVGKVGTIADLKVTRIRPDSDFIEAEFGSISVLIDEYPRKGVGVGKVLPAEQKWYILSVIENDRTGRGREGWYIIVPADKAPKKK